MKRLWMLAAMLAVHQPLLVASGQTLPATTQATTTKASTPVRPQEPLPPLPYEVTHLFVPGGAPNVQLGATITTPRTAGVHPAIVLVAGSGPNDRDENIFGHKPFMLWADRLTRAGFVVLRYDKRGIAKSTGNQLTATTADFADDAEAAVKYLRAQKDVGTIGIIGHSEGGLIAPMVSARNPDVGFVVLLAGPGVSGAKILELQVGASLRLAGMKPDYVARQVKLQHDIMGLVVAGDTAGIEAALFKEMLGAAEPGAPSTRPAHLDIRAHSAAVQLSSPWFTYFARYDPAPTLATLKVPVLAVNGAMDCQVDPGVNLTAIEKALSPETKAKSTIKQLTGLNHLLQPAKTGAVAEYGSITTTVDESALKVVVDWCLEQAAQPAGGPATAPATGASR